MPAKNAIKLYAEYQYYHVYNRGVAKQTIFQDQADKCYFLGLLDRHMNPNTSKTDAHGKPYRHYHQDLEVLCYCLMNNHFHLLLYMEDSVTATRDLMYSIGTSYTMYFNLKYKRVGPLFQGVCKASRISSDSYLAHISRYIHLNPREYQTYKYSSLPDYLEKRETPWLKPQKIKGLFEPYNPANYLSFLADHEKQKNMLESIKYELANF